jgi:hypothetical protein
MSMISKTVTWLYVRYGQQKQPHTFVATLGVTSPAFPEPAQPVTVPTVVPTAEDMTALMLAEVKRVVASMDIREMQKEVIREVSRKWDNDAIIEAITDHYDASTIAGEFCTTDIAREIDISAADVAAELNMSDLASEIDMDDLVKRVVEALMEKHAVLTITTQQEA